MVGEGVFGIYIKSLSFFSNYILNLKHKQTRFGSEKLFSGLFFWNAVTPYKYKSTYESSSLIISVYAV